jgi:uncharacterized membrane protein YdbT with pleckstrin-like domain
MARYIDKRLYDGEHIVYRGRFHALSWVPGWLALIFLGIVVVGIVIFIAEQIRLRTTEFAVTDRRVILKSGFFRADVQEVTLDAIEGSAIHQGLFGRLFRFGNLTIRGRGDTHIHFPTMARPSLFRAEAEHARHESEQEPAERIVRELDEIGGHAAA